MHPVPRPPDAPPNVVADTFVQHDETLRRHARALLFEMDLARHPAQADDAADDVLQDAQFAALRHADQFDDLDADEARLNKAKTFVWNAVRSARGPVFRRRRSSPRLSDDASQETEPLSHDEHLSRLAATPDHLADEVEADRQRLIAALPLDLDRLTMTLADQGFLGQDLADQIAERTGQPCSYAAAAARLSRVRARLLARLETIYTS